MARSAKVKLTSVPGRGPDPVAAIATWPDERLRVLLQCRPDLADPAPRSRGVLAERAVSPLSVGVAYESLDRAARQILEVAALVAPPVGAGAVASILAPGVAPEDLRQPWQRLDESALLLRAGTGWVLNPGLDGAVQRNGLGPSAAPLLLGHTMPVLGAICQRLGVPAGKTKDDSIGAILAFIADPGELRRLLRNAPSGAAGLLERAGAGYQVGVSGPWGLDDKSPAGWLYQRALLVPLDWYRLVLPGEVALALRGGTVFESFSAVPPDLAAAPVDPSATNATGCERALALVDQLGAVLDALGAQPAKRLKDGGLGIREVRRVAKLAGVSERDAARLLDLAVAAGLLWIDPALDAALPTAAFDCWARLPASQRWAELAAGWLTADFEPSLAGAIGTNDKPIPPVLSRGGGEVPAARRQRVLRALLDVPPGSAAGSQAVSERARWESPVLFDGGPALPATLVGWVLEEADLLAVCCNGALTSFGRHLAAGDLDAATGDLTALAPAATTEFVVQADLTAIAAGTLAPDVLAELDLLADLESKGAATVFRFSEQSLRRAFDAGRTAPGISEFLARHAPRGVPQALSYLVADTGRRHGVARVGPARCYIRSDDTGLLAELARARATRSVALRPLAPTVLVSDREAAEVLAALRAGGYLPAEEDGGGGLVVTRKAARRAPARPHDPPSGPILPGSGSGPGPTRVDIDAVLAGLRGATPSPSPGPSPSPSPEAPHRPAALKAVPSPPLFDSEPSRPAAIEHGSEAIATLLETAFFQDWMVRLSYRNGRGASSQLNVWILDVGADDVIVQVLPRFDQRTLRLERIEWARALTEAEEEFL